ncbi:MAG: LysR family transcriptional regulator [Pseudomonadota bacterium]
MDLRQLRYFTLVADLKSLAQASAHLGIAAPALSRSIGALEGELKCPLFERDGRGMRLTAAGEILHGKAVQILRDIELARQDVMAEGEHLAGDVGIGATPSVIGLLGADFIKQSLDRFPKVRPRLAEGYSGYLQNWVLTGVVDFALINGQPPSHIRLHCERLAVERLFAIERPASATGSDDAVALDDLLDAPLLLPSAQNPIRGLIDEAAERLGRTVSTTLEIDSAGLLKTLAADGLAAAVLPFAAVQQEVASGKLSARPIVEPEITSDLTLIHLKDRPPSKVAAELIGLILDILEDVVSGDGRHGFVEVCRPERYRR